LPIAEVNVYEAEGVVRLCVVGVERQRLRARLDGFGVAPPVKIGERETVVGVEVTGVKADRTEADFDRVKPLAQFAEGDAQAAVCFDEVGPNTGRALVTLD